MLIHFLPCFSPIGLVDIEIWMLAGNEIKGKKGDGNNVDTGFGSLDLKRPFGEDLADPEGREGRKGTSHGGREGKMSDSNSHPSETPTKSPA